MSNQEWEEAIGGVTPEMRYYVKGMQEDMKDCPVKPDCSNLASLQMIGLAEEVYAEITDGFDKIPGETLVHKLIYLAFPTHGNMGFIITSTEGKTFTVCMTNDPSIRARLEDKTRAWLN
jgi:hypothetical protein